MMYGSLYILSILLLYIFLFKDIFVRFFTKVGIVFVNDAELRGGGGLITMVCEVYLFLGIPYRFVKFTHEEINRYSEPSIYPFNTYLTKDLFFRDTNFSFFHTDNFERMSYFYQRNFSRKPPDVWMSIPYSFIEYIFVFPWAISFHGFQITQSNLFRSLSHIAGDNSFPPGKRKHILFGIIIYWIFLCLIPFVPHFLLWSFYLFRKNGDIGYSHYRKTIQNPFIGICENNIKGRKGNRYIYGSQEYVFQVDSYDECAIYGTGKLIIQKNLTSQAHFPFVGNYNFYLNVNTSKHFTFIGGTNVYLSMAPGNHMYHEIPFEFRLPRIGSIDILRQACLQNTEIIVNFTTPPYKILPKTNLVTQNDHWHFTRMEFKKDFGLQYTVVPDISPLRMNYRAILSERIVQISFQKSLKVGGKFEFSYDGHIIAYEQIDYHEENRTIIFHLSEDIPHYPPSQRDKTLKVKIVGLEDESGCIHYSKNSRTIWFPWRNIGDK